MPPETQKADNPVARDPLVQQALYDPLMTEPDLASQNEAGAALTIGFDHVLPPIEQGEALAADARNKARLMLFEGGEIENLPKPVKKAHMPILADKLTAPARALAYGGMFSCAKNYVYGPIWGAHLPAYAPIFPRGALIEAAASDAPACRLRVVSYASRVRSEDILQFYFVLASRAGLAPKYVLGAERAIIAQTPNTALVVQLYKRDDGLNRIDIISLNKTEAVSLP